MSLREEDDKKNGCSSRGLGLATVAVGLGVGIGAALYYIFSKQETPATAGSTSSQWNETPQFLEEDVNTSMDYTTVSENTTTDTSMYDTLDSTRTDDDEISDDSDVTSSPMSSPMSSPTLSPTSSPVSSLTSSPWSTSSPLSALDGSEWDEDDIMSLSLPDLESLTISPLRSFVGRIITPIRRRPAQSRERSWTLETCSICFEVILKDQEVMSLPCTHHFHQPCILPWLEAQQTCPNCRKPIE